MYLQCSALDNGILYIIKRRNILPLGDKIAKNECNKKKKNAFYYACSSRDKLRKKNNFFSLEAESTENSDFELLKEKIIKKKKKKWMNVENKIGLCVSAVIKRTINIIM